MLYEVITWLFSVFHKTPFFSPMVFEMLQEQPGPKLKKVAVFEINQLDAQESMSYWSEAARVRSSMSARPATARAS